MSDIQVITQPITRVELQSIADERFGDMVKAVVDLRKKIMAVGGEMHADEEAVLLEQGSRQEDLWGINLYPAAVESSWLEFDSIINIRPRQGNRIRGVGNLDTQNLIREVVSQLVSY